jgi:Dimerisation domain
MSSTYDSRSATIPVETPPAMRLIQMIQGYQATQVVATVAQLGLADLLTKGPRSSTELTGATGADPDGLLRLLRATTTVGLITEVEPDRFTLTPVGDCLATNAQPASLRDVAIMTAAPGHWLPAGRLLDAVMTGHSAAKTALGRTRAADPGHLSPGCPAGVHPAGDRRCHTNRALPIAPEQPVHARHSGGTRTHPRAAPSSAGGCRLPTGANHPTPTRRALPVEPARSPPVLTAGPGQRQAGQMDVVLQQLTSKVGHQR